MIREIASAILITIMVSLAIYTVGARSQEDSAHHVEAMLNTQVYACPDFTLNDILLQYTHHATFNVFLDFQGSVNIEVKFLLFNQSGRVVFEHLGGDNYGIVHASVNGEAAPTVVVNQTMELACTHMPDKENAL